MLNELRLQFEWPTRACKAYCSGLTVDIAIVLYGLTDSIIALRNQRLTCQRRRAGYRSLYVRYRTVCHWAACDAAHVVIVKKSTMVRRDSRPLT